MLIPTGGPVTHIDPATVQLLYNWFILHRSHPFDLILDRMPGGLNPFVLVLGLEDGAITVFHFNSRLNSELALSQLTKWSRPIQEMTTMSDDSKRQHANNVLADADRRRRDAKLSAAAAAGTIEPSCQAWLADDTPCNQQRVAGERFCVLHLTRQTSALLDAEEHDPWPA